MAGIGFALRRLSRHDTLTAGLLSHAHAAAVSAGPWLFTVVALGGVEMFGRGLLPREELARFSTVIIYNFAFSLVLAGPIVLVVTRHLADKIYAKDVEDAAGMLLGALALLYGVQALIAVPFYGFVVDMPAADRVLAIVGFFVVGGIWLASVFLSALKSFETISAAFGVGMAAALFLAILLTKFLGATGTLAGFTVGLALVFYILVARIFAEYPYDVVRPFAFLRAFRSHWEFAVIGLLYNAAIWVDKWVMWLSPGHKVIAGAMVVHPAYDGAMFLAYLTIIPAMTFFLVSLETRFFEKYLQFYRDIASHATNAEIRRSHEEIVGALREGFRNIAVLQTVICYVAILVAPGLIGMARGGLELVPIFRFGVLGALFQSLLLFTLVIISYFDLRRVLLAVTAVFFFLNATLTWVFIPLGVGYQGYGYFLATLLSFVFAYAMAARRISRLPYITFIANNPALR